MIEVQRRLRELLGLPDDFDAFGTLSLRWLAQSSQRVVLRWEKHGPREILVHPRYRASIHPDENTMALEFVWPGRGSRILARGEAADLRRHLEDVLSAGGPYGGPQNDEPPPADPARRRFLAMTYWEGPAEIDQAWTICFGAGYEARVRPIAGQHCLVIVSPRGSFILPRFGLHLSMACAVSFYQGADDAFDEDFHSSSRPFQVRIRGVPHRLLHAPIPGLVGYATTEVGEVYLCLLGVNDSALVLVADGEPPRCLVRGGIAELNDWELRPGEAPAVQAAAPDSFDRDDVAAALGRLAALASPIREHLVALAQASMIADGTREVRRLLWAFGAAHEKGQHLDLCVDAETLWRRMFADAALTGLPGERTRRDALHWLAERSPLVVRARAGRRVLWRLRFGWLSKPTQECLAAIAEIRGRLTKEAEPPRRNRTPRSPTSPDGSRVA